MFPERPSHVAVQAMLFNKSHGKWQVDVIPVDWAWDDKMGQSQCMEVAKGSPSLWMEETMSQLRRSGLVGR